MRIAATIDRLDARLRLACKLARQHLQRGQRAQTLLTTTLIVALRGQSRTLLLAALVCRFVFKIRRACLGHEYNLVRV